MTILFITIAWPRKGERNLYSDLMDEFVNQGHQVCVLCSDESAANTHLELYKDIEILRVRSSKIRKANKLRKALSLFTLGINLKGSYKRYWADKNVDLIIGHSPPITLSGLLRSMKEVCDAPLYYLLKDIWPDGPADLNFIKRNGFVYKFFRRHETRLYKTADVIGCMSPMNVEYILRKNRYLSEDKVEVCPNTISPRTLSLNTSKSKIRRKYNIPEHSTVFIFSGNLGRAHGLSFYMDVIDRLKDTDDAYFLIGGSGQYFNFVRKEISRRGLCNIGTYSRLPSDDFEQVLLASDVGVILLDSKYAVPQFPSRLLAYLEAGKPVLCAVNKDTDIGHIVQEAQCGKSVLHGDMISMIQEIQYFCDKNNSGALDLMGENSSTLLHQKYTSVHAYDIIMKHFRNIKN